MHRRTAWTWTRPGWEAAVAVLLLVLSLVVFVKLTRYIDRLVVDDALISIGYARSFVDGEGLRPTPYSAISEGYSNPTWTFLLAVFERLHINSMIPAKVVGMGLAALSLPLVFAWGPISQRRRIHLEDALAPMFACTNATFAYWSLGGLEGGVLCFLVALFGALVFAPRTKKVAVGLGLSGAALALTRPEAALYVAAIGLPALVDWAVTTRLRPRRSDWLAIAAFLVPIALYVGARRLYFGAWLPNTYYAKASWYVGADMKAVKAVAVAHIRLFVKSINVLWIAAGCGLAISVFLGGLRIAKTAVAAALVVTAMVFFTWYANADWMKEWRFLAPTLPFVCYPLATGVTALRRQFGRAFLRRRGAWLRVGLHVVVAVGAVVLLYRTSKQHEARWLEVKNEGGDTPREPKDRELYGKDFRDMLSPFNMTHPSVASPDMGYIAVGLRDMELIDLAGLTDVPIARHYRNANALRDYFNNEGLPTIMTIWGPSNYLWSMGDVLANYKSAKYDSYKVYARVTATEDDRCPLGKTRALTATTDQMIAGIVGELNAGQPVRALALWRCYFAYRKDADLPSVAQRVEIAFAAQAVAEKALGERKGEPALRAYSLCAVVGAASYRPSSSCRMMAERIRGKLFPRPPK